MGEVEDDRGSRLEFCPRVARRERKFLMGIVRGKRGATARP